MKKKLITVLTVAGALFRANKGAMSEFTILLLVTLISGLLSGSALCGACTGTVANAGLGKVLDLLRLSFSSTPRPAVLGIAVGTLLALAIL